jgi:hypothetical protein
MATVIHPNHSWVPHTTPHKRGHSTSAITLRTPEYRVQKEGRSSFENPFSTPTHSGSGHPHSLKIKPYLKKLSLNRDSSHTIDLSRPAAENESLTGLGFYHDDSRSGSDLAFPSPTFPSPIASRGISSRHQRSTSNNSTFSTTSHHRPTAPYAHPLRATPPIQRSYTAQSLLAGSDENSDEAVDIMSDEPYRSRAYGGPGIVTASRRSGSMGSLPAVSHPLHAMSSSPSLTRLNNLSQSSLPSSSLPNSTGTGRSRGDTLRSVDSTAVPSSARTSMEKAMGFLRASTHSQPKSSDDLQSEAAARAAHIMAARLAYAEREEAKERKHEKEAIKAADRANKKRVAREEKQRRKSESGTISPTPFFSATGGSSRVSSDKRDELVGIAYQDHTPVHSRSLPAHVPTASAQGTSGASNLRREKGESEHRGSLKSRWLAFVAWFRTRLLRMSRR